MREERSRERLVSTCGTSHTFGNIVRTKLSDDVCPKGSFNLFYSFVTPRLVGATSAISEHFERSLSVGCIGRPLCEIVIVFVRVALDVK